MPWISPCPKAPPLSRREGVVVKTQNSQSGREQPVGQLCQGAALGRHHGRLHLMRDSVVVKEGQRVRQGQMLAKSGNTGNSTGPHLHFVVQRNVGLALESIPPVRQAAQRLAGLYCG